MDEKTQTALDALFGAPATVAEPQAPVLTEVAPLPQPVPIVVITQPVPVRAPAEPMCMASRRPLTSQRRRPVSGYPYWTRAEREQRQRKIEQHLAWNSDHIDPADDYCDG